MAYQVLLIFLAVFLQTNRYLEIGGINPNLVLITLIVFIFATQNWLRYLTLVLIAILLLKIFPGIDWQAIVVGVAALISYFLKKATPLLPYFSNAILIAASTLGVALLALPNMFVNIVLGEIFYNVVIGTAGLYFFIHEKK